MKLLILDELCDDCVLICREDRVATTSLITRDIIAVQSFRTVTQADDFTHTDVFLPTEHSLSGTCIYSVCPCGGGRRGRGWRGGRGSRASRESGLRFQTAITRKRLETNLSIQYGAHFLLNRLRAIDWNRFRGRTMTYNGDSGSR